MEKFIVMIESTGPLTKDEHNECAQAIKDDLEEVLGITGLCADTDTDSKLRFKVEVT